ncbi:hypothetical protein J41TS12_23970 [Paenibacillus antibioticophila]|uniref:Uncharacterized protein n=1 Tax=Paenibacillus antibioticophila TaxID=1274374 RepID=A0A919XQS0_9BACL|nr:hypothetical protein J41TS12_23970 [Paenibacillus antibioticophila]
MVSVSLIALLTVRLQPNELLKTLKGRSPNYRVAWHEVTICSFIRAKRGDLFPARRVYYK